jgi:uncharacterized protein (TIGR00369 family)
VSSPLTPGLEQVRKLLTGEVPPPAVAHLIGLRIVAAEADRAVFELEADDRHANPMGTLHGGILCDLADAAMGTAMATTLGAGETYTTLDLSINFLKPVWKATLTATGQVLKRSRRVGLVECRVLDQTGSLVAHAKSTCLVLTGDDAVGR